MYDRSHCPTPPTPTLAPPPSKIRYLHKYVEPATWHHLMLTHIFCKGELRRRYIAMKTILYTCTASSQLKCSKGVAALLDTLTHSCCWILFFFFMFLLFFLSFFLSFVTGISIAEAKWEYVLWNWVPDYFFFFVYSLICIFVHAHACTSSYMHTGFSFFFLALF